MCDLCLQSPCSRNCPNSGHKPKPVFVCGKCGYGLYYGDDAYRIDDETVWCENCMIDASFEIKL